MRVLAIDTETTGVDLHHSARPFFVTAADDEGNQWFWPWPVDPKSRMPDVPPSDLDEIRDIISSADTIVGHNLKFDVTALGTVGIVDWPWDKSVDTMVAGHILESNRPKNLTDMAMRWLSDDPMFDDIEPLEIALKNATVEARRAARNMTKKHGWNLARADGEGMPSVSGENGLWKADTWLPKLLWTISPFIRKKHPEWETVLRDYANADSAITVSLWKRVEKEIFSRGLMKVFQHHNKIPAILCRMDRRGVTYDLSRSRQVIDEMREESLQRSAECVGIAKEFGYDLDMPKGSTNQSLREFCLEVMKLPRVYNGKSKTGEPTLDSKNAVPYWLSVVKPKSLEHAFVTSLADKRIKDTVISYLEGYERYAVSYSTDGSDGSSVDSSNQDRWAVLYCSINQTGTDTTRFSTSNPSTQNVAKDPDKSEGRSPRWCFGPAPGREWWSMDASNIELRIPAYESGERELIDLFENPGPPYWGSVHLINFHTVYDDIWDKVLAEVGYDRVGPECKKRFKSTWYQWCKNGGLGMQYGCGKDTADRTFRRPGSFELMQGRFAKLTAHNQRCIAHAKEFGYVTTIPSKFIDPDRGYPLICSRSESGWIIPTVPLNYRTQGTAGEWNKSAMIRCDEQLQKWQKERFDGHMILTVHDELVFDFPRSKVHPKEDVSLEKTRATMYSAKRYRDHAFRSNLWRARVLQKLMELGGDDIGIPTPVNVTYHSDNWQDGEEF